MTLFITLAVIGCLLSFALGFILAWAIRKPPAPPEWTEPHIPSKEAWQSAFNAARDEHKHEQLSERARAMPRDAVTGRFQKRVQQDSSQTNSLN